MREFTGWLTGAAFVAMLNVAPSSAQAAQRPVLSWTSLTAGIGPAGASSHRDTVYEGSGQSFAVIAYARQLAPMRALDFEVLGGRPFGAGDCIPGSTICAPAFNYVGASAGLLTSLGGPIGPDRFLAGIGAGVFRVAPSESHAVSPRPALGLHAMLDVPVIVGTHAALAVGIHGLVFPLVHGQSLGMALLTTSLRVW
jgi:hypothetical protein